MEAGLCFAASCITYLHLTLTLNRASVGIYARTVLYCTVLRCNVQYWTVIDFSPNTMYKVMWKSQGPRTSVSILNTFYKIIILFVSDSDITINIFKMS